MTGYSFLDRWGVDPRSVHDDVLGAMRQGAITPLDAAAELPPEPGLYGLAMVAPDRAGLYLPAVNAGTVLYVGSTCDLRGRLIGYRDRIALASGIRLADMVAVTVTMLDGPEFGLLAERLALSPHGVGRPPWNYGCGPVWGLAGNPPGRRRLSLAPPFWMLHPARAGSIWDRGTPDATATRSVAAALGKHFANHGPGTPILR